MSILRGTAIDGERALERLACAAHEVGLCVEACRAVTDADIAELNSTWAKRLGIPRKEAAEIIDHYFAQFPGIRKYMTDTIEFARHHGYVETITGRRRYLRDIRSANASVRGAAERNAINTPIQGTAADMIKLAMVHIHREFAARKLKTKMILQVHDELVFDLYRAEQEEVMALVEDKMKTAIRLDVQIVVEIGVGKDWLETH